MARQNQKINQLFHSLDVLLENAVDAAIKPHIEKVGLTEAKISETKVELASARGLDLEQKMKYGDKYAATKELNLNKDQVRETYMSNIEVCRVAFSDNRAALQKLGVEGEREKDYVGLLAQIQQFYSAALGDAALQPTLSEHGLTKEVLEAEKQLVDDVEAADKKQKLETGNAQQATFERNLLVKKLEKKHGQYRRLARVALKDKPQLLEKLGIVK